jgi:hypothetical protein
VARLVGVREIGEELADVMGQRMAELNIADVLLFPGGSSPHRLGNQLTHALRGSDATELPILTLHNVHYRRDLAAPSGVWKRGRGLPGWPAGRCRITRRRRELSQACLDCTHRHEPRQDLSRHGIRVMRHRRNRSSTPT